MATWKALLGRVTLFPSIPTGADIGTALDLYKRTWNLEPDSYQKQANPTLPFAPSVAQGSDRGIGISCSVHPIRIDLSISPIAQPGPALNVIEDTKLFHNAFEQVLQSVAKNNSTSVTRAACFVQFGCVARDYRDANAIIRTILPEQYAIQLADEQEFILQVNRPEQIEETTMNRITK
jgi:hypothetical protein